MIDRSVEQVLEAALEAARWARPPGSSRKDGVPADGCPRRAAPTDPAFPQRDYSWRHDWGGDGGAGTSIGVPAPLTTTGDGREEWIACGQPLQHVLLRAAAHGVSAAFHTQALELDLLREFLRREFRSGEHPQMITRLGVTFDGTSAVRRPLADLVRCPLS
ncbi:hypothetical protein ACWDA3_44940 [Nonomuraea rubra]